MNGYTVGELCERWRVGEAKVRGWIRRGELKAIDLAGPGSSRTRLVVTQDAVAEFERSRESRETVARKPRRRRKQVKDYFE